MTPYKAHLFVCTQSPDKEGKCGHKNSEILRQKVKKACQEQGLGKSIRINSSGCLGHCESGIAAVLYPSSDWKLNLNENSEKELIDLILSRLKEESETHK